MANYLQNIYKNLVKRVYVSNPDRKILVDQWCFLQSSLEKNPTSGKKHNELLVNSELKPEKESSESGGLRFNPTITQVRDTSISVNGVIWTNVEF